MTTILECSKFNDTDSNINSSWNNVFNDPITIQNGDMVSLKTAFIDTNVLGSGDGQVDIDTDTTVTIRFGYYSNSIYPENKTFVGPAFPHSTPALAFTNTGVSPNEVPGELLTDIFSFVVPAGIYSGQDIAEFITRKCSEVTPQIYTVAERGPPLSNNPFLQSTTTTVKYPMFVSFNEVNGTCDKSKYWYYEGAMNYWYGTSQFGVSYDAEMDGRFKIDQLHISYFQGDPAVESVGYVKDSILLDFFPVSRHTGIFLTDLEPPTFWEALGFDVKSITCSNNDALNR